MLISKEVEVRVTSQTKDYYYNLGYDIPKGKNSSYSSKKKIFVKTEDLTPKSNVQIILKCDYCGKVFPRRYADHTFIINKHIIDKDACSECAQKKFEEVYLLKNGVENPFQLESVKEKIKISNIENFGYENPMYSDEIKEKLRQASIEKYGVDNPSKSEEIKQKIVDVIQEKFGVENIMDLKEYRLKIAETLSKNHTVSTSKQQIYIHKIYGGILNYCNDTPVLDIAFPEDMIYIEYNGGGHRLSIKLGDITEEKFEQRELKRYHYLKDKGWNAIFIDSDDDKIPNDIKLREMYDVAIKYFNGGEKWIKFDIDKGLIKFKNNRFNYDFGRLRKIKDKDLEAVS